jgi:hypothetical protein
MVEVGDTVEVALATKDERLALHQEPGSVVEWLPAIVEAVGAGFPALNLVVKVGGEPYRFSGVMPAVLPAGIPTPTDPAQQDFVHGHYRVPA